MSPQSQRDREGQLLRRMGSTPIQISEKLEGYEDDETCITFRATLPQGTTPTAYVYGLYLPFTLKRDGADLTVNYPGPEDADESRFALDRILEAIEWPEGEDGPSYPAGIIWINEVGGTTPRQIMDGVPFLIDAVMQHYASRQDNLLLILTTEAEKLPALPTGREYGFMTAANYIQLHNEMRYNLPHGLQCSIDVAGFYGERLRWGDLTVTQASHPGVRAMAGIYNIPETEIERRLAS